MIDEDGNGQIEVDEYLEWWGDDELIELYERQQDALEGGKPYRAMGQQFRLLDAPGRLEKVQILFDDCDVGAKGYLMPWEFAKLSAGLGVKLSPSELSQAVEEIDEDGNGQIEVDEYLEWWSDPELIALYENQCDALEAGKPYRVMGDQLANGSALERLAVVRKLFDDCDIGSKEYLMPEEFGQLSKYLGVKLGAAELRQAVEEIDEDGNGQIEVDEYLDWWGDPELIELYKEDPDRKMNSKNWNFASEWLDSLGKEEVVIDRSGAGDKGRLANRDLPNASDSEDEDEGDAEASGEKKKKKKKLKPEDLCNRVNWIVVTLNRLVDLHKFHLLWDHMSDREREETLSRLGWLTVFDPVSPERRFYMDLSNREQRVVAACLVKLAIIEPGENWLYEGFENIPGWQLPVSWTTAIPLSGELKLTYSSTAAGCAPVWDERVKLRRISLVPQDAPVPSMDDLIWGSESDKLMSYVGFVRLMQDPYHVMRTITKARRDLFDKRNRNEDESESSEEEDDVDSDEADMGDGGSEIGDVVMSGNSTDGGTSALDAGQSRMSQKSSKSGVSGGGSRASVADPTGSQTIKDVADDGMEEEDQDWELLMPIDKYGRMAILLLEECRHNFLKSSKENDDLEEALSEEWVNFANLTKIRFEDHPDMRVSVLVVIILSFCAAAPTFNPKFHSSFFPLYKL